MDESAATTPAAAVADAVDVTRIMQMIPHRYPFLLIDRVVDIVPGDQLRVSAMSDSEPPPHLLGASLAGRGDHHQFGSGEPLGVLGVEGAHSAETGDAEPKRTRRP